MIQSPIENRKWFNPSFIPIDRLLTQLPCVHVSDEGRQRVSHGRELEEFHLRRPGAVALHVDPPGQDQWVRLLDDDGRLLALATPDARSGALHPSVVLI
jgi:hypothetical protein